MEDTDEPSAERLLVHSRTSQACQRCRSLKTRCLPGEQSGTCRRCFSAKRECVWAQAPRRIKRTRMSRIAQVERKIDGLVANLVDGEKSRTETESLAVSASSEGTKASNGFSVDPVGRHRQLAPGSWMDFPSSFEQQPEPPVSNEDIEPTQHFLAKLQTIHNFSDESDMSRPPRNMFMTSSRKERPLNDDFVRNLVSNGEADGLLKEYCTMMQTVPFVPIPPDITAEEFITTKPMLFLAVITAASWRDHSRQMVLDKKYRMELANRTIIQPHRTLSLVQSIVVYLSWYHFVFSHKTQQIFSLLQLGIGLALDLGLHQKIRRALEVPGRANAKRPSPEEQRERQRTLLGCYYLSSAISVGLLKPNLLRYNDYMAECARTLRSTNEFASDSLIGRLISLRRIDDLINEMLNGEEVVDLSLADPRISMNMRGLESQLYEWRRENNSDGTERTLELSYAFTDMQLHAVALRPSSHDYQHQSSSTDQLNALLATLEAGKRFLDTLLALPVTQYHLFNFSEWMRLPAVVITMSRLCIPSDVLNAAQWDVKAAQDRVRLDLYLDSLCYRMQDLTTFDKPKQPHIDFWFAMKMIMDMTRKWYCRKIEESSKTSSASQPTPPHLPTPDTLSHIQFGDVVGSLPSENNCAFDMHVDSFGTIGVNEPHAGSTGGFRGPLDSIFEAGLDMGQFVDMGVWGHETYEALGFGGGGMGF